MTALNNLSVAVVGAGKMGENHVRIYEQMRNIHKVYVYDTDYDKAFKLSEKYDCIPVRSAEDLSTLVQAVSIVTPTKTHAEIAKYYLNQKIHCLVEKPFSDSFSACNELVSIAQENDCLLMVGHVERFNPVVMALKAVLYEENFKILAIHANRMSFDSSRVNDINVVMDLMVHDLDIICSLVSDDFELEHASGITLRDTQSEGHVNVILRSNSGILASITASRITSNKIRTLDIICDKAVLSLDYISQNLTIYRQESPSFSQDTFGRDKFKIDSKIEKIYIRNQEPLFSEINHFINSIKEKTEPETSGQKILPLMDLIFKVQERLKK